MIRLLLLFAATALFLYSCRLSGQEIPERLLTHFPLLDAKLASLVKVDSMAISPAAVERLENPLLLDAREREEFQVSHLPGALYLGYKKPDFERLAKVDKERPLVVYCTVGFRSERMAKQLRDRGFKEVYNLFGSLYAWKLSGRPLVDADGPTDRLHTYDKKWGTYVPDTIGVKVY